MKLILISGHGGSDPGAVYENLIERDINQQIVDRMFNILFDYDVEIILETSEMVVSEEVKFINQMADADTVAVSIHNNAGGGIGFEGYYYSTNQKAKLLLQTIERHVIDAGQKSRGLKAGDHLTVIKNVKPLSILLEGFFIDNPNDRPDIMKLANAYAQGIIEYFDLYKTDSTGKTEEHDCIYKRQIQTIKEILQWEQ